MTTYNYLTSIAFCLEDSICDSSLALAESTLKNTLHEIYDNLAAIPRLPKIFIRVRTPKHLVHVHKLYQKYHSLIAGYILPKFDMSNAEAYIKIILNWRQTNAKQMFIMPTLESENIAFLKTRHNELYQIKQALLAIKDSVLNIRVGGNDFLRIYALRCPITHTIYDIGVVRDILIDIINVFATDYIVAGPVFNYIDSTPSDLWVSMLQKEICADKLHGFIGKTAIHPCQVKIILQNLMVDQADYADACKLLTWDDTKLGVAKSSISKRLNEVKTHLSWARRIKLLGDYYGVNRA